SQPRGRSYRSRSTCNIGTRSSFMSRIEGRGRYAPSERIGLLEVRDDLLGQQVDRVHDPLIGELAAGVDVEREAGQAERLFECHQALDNRLGRAVGDPWQDLVIGYFVEPPEPLERFLVPGSAERLSQQPSLTHRAGLRLVVCL